MAGSFNFSQMLPALMAMFQHSMTPGMQQAASANGAMTPQDAASATVAGVEPGAPTGVGGGVGQALTPQQQAIAAASGAVSPADAATATVAGIQPNAANPAANAGSNAALAALAQKLQGNGGAPPQQARPAPMVRSGAGAGPMPIASQPMKPAMPQQRPTPPPMAVGAMAMSDPQMAALVKQLQALNGPN